MGKNFTDLTLRNMSYFCVSFSINRIFMGSRLSNKLYSKNEVIAILGSRPE